MKYVATVPSSSTSYYRSQRCRLANSGGEMEYVGSSSETTDLSIARQRNVSIEAAESSTTSKEEETEADEKKYTKPTQSYVMMIATAIMESSDQRMSLGAIYRWIEKHYPYFTNNDATQGRWRNSVRHNLSLNDCFIKVGRCEDGKGNYWSIHPQNLADFQRGDFKQKQSRRRRGRRKSADAYLSLLASSGQVIMDTNTGLPLYSPYTDEERKAYRLDEALVKRNLKGSLHFLPHQMVGERVSSPGYGRQPTNQHPTWQHPTTAHMSHTQESACYYPPYTPAVPCNTYSNIGPNVNYHHYYHHSAPCSTGSSPCQCCPTPTSIPPLYQQHRYGFE